MDLFGPEHRAWQEENSRKLKERLEKTVSNPEPGLMGQWKHEFSRNLLNSMNTRKVKGKK